MKRYLLIAILAIASTIAEAREVTILKKWHFINEDFTEGEAPNLDTERWREVKIPHDWAIGEHFDMNIDKQMVRVTEDGEKVPKLRTGRTGALPVFNVGWYRCEVEPIESDGKRVSIEFDGAMSEAQVYLNGEWVGEWLYGYSSFQFDLSSRWRTGEKNTIAVRLQNRELSSRWYPGAGLYRNVRLVVTSPARVAHWGTYVTTPEVSSRSAKVAIRTCVENHNDSKGLRLLTTIFDEADKRVASTKSKIEDGEESSTLNQELTIARPKLWSPESPILYSVVTQILASNGELLDEYHTTMGIRTIEFNNERGFLLNGAPYKIKGVCLHHDLGALGAAVNYRATERQLEMMKHMGCNSIRTSHNPPSPELLDLCDRMGLLVQVEAFDEWKIGKNKNGYNRIFEEWAELDLVAMIHRDRNHPSVIMWSIGNEIREQSNKEGWRVAKMLADICRREDPTRPITAGLNSHKAAIKNGLTDHIDLVGFNYKPHDYAIKQKKYPHYIIYGSETASTVSSRGDYKFPAEPNKNAYHLDYTVSSYDMDYVPWGTTPDMEFAAQQDNPSIFGEYVWTGFDYLGEPTPYNEGSPARSSYFGIVDLAGFPKDRYFLYQSHWSSEPMLHLLPHWSWKERIGEKVPVFCYTTYAEVELFVNGESQGRRSKDPKSEDIYKRYRLMWHDVVYQPGKIEAVAYDSAGVEQERVVICTAKEPSVIRLTPDRTTITADGADLSYVTIEILDSEGNLCPRADNMLFVTVEGNASLRALCNGSPTDHTPFSSNYMRAYNGKLMAIIESGEGSGESTIYVSCPKLKSGTTKITLD